jgi:hypothetical protein
MPFDELALQAVTRLAQMEIAIRIALVLCGLLGVLPDGMPMKPAWDMSWTLAELFSWRDPIIVGMRGLTFYSKV